MFGRLEAFGTSVDWLISGEGEAIADTKSVMVKLPVLCWNRIQDRHRLGEVTVVASESIDAECYALMVQGHAMRGEFPDGSIVIVNPEVRPAPGNHVVASVHGAAVLRQLQVDGSARVLKALDPSYPAIPVTDGVNILGVVVWMMKAFD